MPQLDSHTFLNQYEALFVVLTFVYICLSYMTLPLTLRSLLIRNSILKLVEGTRAYKTLREKGLSKTVYLTIFAQQLATSVKPLNDVLRTPKIWAAVLTAGIYWYFSDIFMGAVATPLDTPSIFSTFSEYLIEYYALTLVSNEDTPAEGIEEAS